MTTDLVFHARALITDVMSRHKLSSVDQLTCPHMRGIAKALERRFPIMQSESIPWSVLAPHEAQAQSNHNQSLETLASRGGLAPCEAIAIIEGRPWQRLPDADGGRARLKQLVSEASK